MNFGLTFTRPTLILALKSVALNSGGCASQLCRSRSRGDRICSTYQKNLNGRIFVVDEGALPPMRPEKETLIYIRRETDVDTAGPWPTVPSSSSGV